MQLAQKEYRDRYGDIKIFCVVCKNMVKKHVRITYRQYLKQKFCSYICRGIWREKYFRGTNNPNYRHGLTDIFQSIRTSARYKKWRIAVFKRDRWTCQMCLKKGGNIEADHIKRFSLFPELRFELSNGRTLCRECHKTTPTWGSKALKLCV